MESVAVLTERLADAEVRVRLMTCDTTTYTNEDVENAEASADAIYARLLVAEEVAN